MTDEKPVKYVLKNNNRKFETKEVEITEYERIVDILKDMRWDENITTEQYRSVKGQARYGNISDALKFIENKSYLELYNRKPKTKQMIIISDKMLISDLKDSKFGIITLK